MKRRLMVLSIFLLTHTVEAESPIVIPLPPQVSTSVADDYSISILNGRRDICKGVIIAPSWVLTAGHCATRGITHVTASKLRFKKEIDKKFKFRKGADLALLKIKSAPFKPESAITLLARPLLSEYGILDNIKVVHNAKSGKAKVYENLKLKAKNRKELKSLTPKGKAGSSGAPWVIKTDNGDVAVGITHGGGVAPQIAQAKKWINKLIAKHTPSEQIKWLEEREVLLQSQ